jgi:hypothetical protein
MNSVSFIRRATAGEGTAADARVEEAADATLLALFFPFIELDFATDGSDRFLDGFSPPDFIFVVIFFACGIAGNFFAFAATVALAGGGIIIIVIGIPAGRGGYGIP